MFLKKFRKQKKNEEQNIVKEISLPLNLSFSTSQSISFDNELNVIHSPLNSPLNNSLIYNELNVIPSPLNNPLILHSPFSPIKLPINPNYQLISTPELPNPNSQFYSRSMISPIDIKLNSPPQPISPKLTSGKAATILIGKQSKYNKIKEMARLEIDRIEGDRTERDRIERNRIERDRTERDRIERNRIERDRIERDRIERNRIERLEKLENKIKEIEKIINQEIEMKIYNENNNKNIDEESKEKLNVNGNEKGDFAVVLYGHNGITSDELNILKGEYLIVTNWDVGDGYAFGYKINDPQKKGKFPFPLVRKFSDNKEMTYTPSYFLKMNQSSLLSNISLPISISSSPNMSPLIQQPTAPLENRLSILADNSSHMSISSSPNTISIIQQLPTAPSETLMEYIYNNRNSENSEIKPNHYHNFENDI